MRAARPAAPAADHDRCEADRRSELGARLYTSAINPGDLSDRGVYWFADIARDGETLAGPFETEEHAMAALEAACA
jgi:hypothetical protein